MVMNEEDRKPILVKIYIIKKVMVIGNWRRNIRRKPGRKSRFFLKPTEGEWSGNYAHRRWQGRSGHLTELYQTAAKQTSTDKKMITSSSPVNQQNSCVSLCLYYALAK